MKHPHICKFVAQQRYGAVFFRKKYRKKHLRHHDKNYCNFSKLNIPVINLVASSTDIQKIFPKNFTFKKYESVKN